MIETLDRKRAFAAVPVHGPIIERHTIEAGGTGLVLAVPTRPLQRALLRLPPTITKKFELDAVGTQILDWCDGKNSVADIVRLFSEKYGIEAYLSEKAVGTFFRSLVSKGIVNLQLG